LCVCENIAAAPYHNRSAVKPQLQHHGHTIDGKGNSICVAVGVNLTRFNTFDSVILGIQQEGKQMRSKAIFASFATISMMSFFVLILIAPFMMAAFSDSGGFGAFLGFGLAVMFTVVVNAIIWFVSPWIMDLTNKWFYRCRDMPLEELGQYRPAVAQFVYNTCQKHGIKVPDLKLIDDMNPTAYCYGSTANRARLVVTRGLLHYLDDEELKAVYAHELGHIIHRDFIVMTIASVLLQILWQIYVAAKNMKGNNKGKDAALAIAVVAYVFWWISQYALLYLSRVREYYADEFAGQETMNPNALSMALVKVAYGIARQPSSEFSKKLMGGTRAMGIADPRSSGNTGHAYAAANGAGRQMAASIAGEQVGEMPVNYEGIAKIEKVFLFDLFNPWASVLELGSTHPVTGKRIKVLCEQATQMRQQPLFRFDPIDAYGRQLDRARLYGNFAVEVAIWFAPQILGLLMVFIGIVGIIAGSPVLTAAGFGGFVLGFGLGMALRGFYAFPPIGQPQMTTVIELMMDPYASPLRGRQVLLQGQLIGRADAGSKFDEDSMMEDQAGGLMMLNYEHWLPFFGNPWFGYKTVKNLIGQPVQARGWFRRGVSQQVDLDEMVTSSGEKISSYTAFWGRLGGVVVALIGLFVMLMFVAGASGTN
jgi:Zn-dependent protease with chaperone function